MTWSKALAVAALSATAMGCSAGSGDEETNDNPDPQIQPVIVEGDAPATPTINCAYPPNGSGVAVGNIVPSFHNWRGVGPGETAVRDVSIGEFFDCSGALAVNGQPVNAVMIDTSKFF